MEKGRNNMSAPVIFFLAAFVLAIVGALMLMRSTDTEGKKAVAIAAAAETIASNLDAKLVELKTVDQDLADRLLEQKNKLDKALQELEWVKMKASIPTTKIVQAPPVGPIKVEPIQVQVVYTQKSKSKSLLPPTKTKPDATTQKVIKSVQQKLKERTQ